MDIEKLRSLCLSMPHAEEDVKWGDDLCFLIGKKMFCATGLSNPTGASLKTSAEEFERLTERNGIEPAKYLARYHWVTVKFEGALSDEQWPEYVGKSYKMVWDGLPKKLREGLSKA